MDGELALKPDIVGRTFAFALRVVRLCKALCKSPGVSRSLGNQVLRSGTSVGANVEEAQAAQSRADFICKMAIALKEARETRYWLRLIQESELLQRELLHGLATECDEICKILGAILRTTRRKPP